ncbi:MAG TPA: hemerythrin family protein [Salinivirgaceae bacterium]|nr:hemerythrin family protein [Salinivirgaceae bacterium]
MNTIEKIAIDLSKLTINPIIDNQHKELFLIINNIIDEHYLFVNSRKLSELLSQLTDYGMKHFKEEEEVMLQNNYVAINEHKKSHYAYLERIAMFNFNFSEGNEITANEVISYIRNWWYDHVLKWDVHLSQFLHSKGKNE